ncbi:hypothetical protein GHNINEIG_01642 [Hydrogenovibrio crunogenus]|uniref:DUF748 domain-containing protein n=1 Tax=Hydrogenovibrio crunogenus TaxID=39765 RepID=A0A4P7P2N6_9GAMM|nr:DUF748 domain-containing protein [Hydrogenovibrio crunogenus]QBZ83582.1 hypothetical protein GHNINEIG_01642 [Hydrogenovibrio crunogenus]
MKAILLRWKSLKTRYKSFIITALVLAVFLFFLPLMLKKTIEYALVQQGAESAQVEKVIINPFSGRLELFNLSVSTNQQQQLNLGHLKVNLGWLDLLQRHINLQTLELFDTTLFLTYQPNEYIRVGGISFPLNTKQSVTTPEEAAKKPFFWGLGFQNLVLKNATLNLKTPELNKVIQFEDVSVSRTANWKPELYSQLGFRIQDDKGLLTGNLDTKIFSDTQVIKGQIQISDFDLHSYQGYLPKTWEMFSGLASGELEVKVKNHYGAVDIQQSGQIGVRNLTLQQQDFQIQSNAVDWNGQLTFSIDKNDGYTLQANGEWQLNQFALTQPQQLIHLEDLKWLGQVNIEQQSKKLQVESRNQLMVSESGFKQDHLDTKIKTLFWKGPLTYQETTATPSQKKSKIMLQGTQLALEKTSVALDDLRVSNDLLQWQGGVNIEPNAEKPMDMSGQLGSSKLIVRNATLNKRVLQLAQMKSNVQFQSPKTIQFKQLSLDDIAVGQKVDSAAPFLQVAGIQLSDLMMDGNSKTELGKVTVHNVDAHLTLNAQHELEEVQALIKSLGETSESPSSKMKSESTQNPVEPVSSETKNAAIKLEQFSVTGQKNHIVFETHGLDSKMKQNIHLKRVELGSLNSEKPLLKTPVKLEATVGKYTKIGLEGSLHPFTQKTNMDVRFNVDELDLYAFSPLIKDALGYRIQSGALTLESDIQIQEDMLKSKNHLALKGFELENSTEESTSTDASNSQDIQADGSLTGGTASLALNLLRDNEGKIELDIPIEGDLSDPSFRLDQVIQKAVLNALQSGSKTMLAMTLQPYGAIYLAAEYAFKQANTVTLQPISYEVGQNKIKPGMAQYLQKIVTLLEDKKKITLKVCGFYNQQDRNYWIQKGLKDQALQDTLYSLAQTRQNQVKDWLVEQGGIHSSRLTTCHPSFEDLPETGVLLSM